MTISGEYVNQYIVKKTQDDMLSELLRDFGTLEPDALKTRANFDSYYKAKGFNRKNKQSQKAINAMVEIFRSKENVLPGVIPLFQLIVRPDVKLGHVFKQIFAFISNGK